jgi:hypothetical protein
MIRHDDTEALAPFGTERPTLLTGMLVFAIGMLLGMCLVASPL